MKLVNVNVDWTQVFVIINNIGMKINAGVNIKTTSRTLGQSLLNVEGKLFCSVLSKRLEKHIYIN